MGTAICFGDSGYRVCFEPNVWSDSDPQKQTVSPQVEFHEVLQDRPSREMTIPFSELLTTRSADVGRIFRAAGLSVTEFRRLLQNQPSGSALFLSWLSTVCNRAAPLEQRVRAIQQLVVWGKMRPAIFHVMIRGALAIHGASTTADPAIRRAAAEALSTMKK